MTIDTQTIANAISTWNSTLKYPKEPTSQLCLVWLAAMSAERISGEEFNLAGMKWLTKGAEFPSPSDIISLVKATRGLPFANPAEVKELPPKPASTNPEDLPVTPEFRKKRIAQMIARFDEIDTKLDRKPDMKARAGLIAMMAGYGLEPAGN